MVPHRKVGDHPRLSRGSAPIKAWSLSMLDLLPIVIVAVDESAGIS